MKHKPDMNKTWQVTDGEIKVNDEVYILVEDSNYTFGDRATFVGPSGDSKYSFLTKIKNNYTTASSDFLSINPPRHLLMFRDDREVYLNSKRRSNQLQELLTFFYGF